MSHKSVKNVGTLNTVVLTLTWPGQVIGFHNKSVQTSNNSVHLLHRVSPWVLYEPQCFLL